MAEMSPLRRRMIEDMTVRNLSPATQRSYVHAVSEVQPIFRPLAGPAGPGGRARLPGPSGVDRHLVAGAEPDGLCAAVLLWRHARAWRDPGAHSLRPGAAQAAGGAERRRGRALSRGGAEPEDPRRADDRLCGGAARLRGGRPQGGRYRQRPDGHPGRARQGRQGPLRHAVGAAARHPAHLLASGPAQHWLFPGRDETKADRRPGAACGLPLGLRRGRAWPSG